MNTQIYLMTPPQISDLQSFTVELEAVCQAQEIASLQIRIKDVGDDEITRVFAKLAPIARAHGAVVIINDDPHLALELGADGVHLGQSDMAVKAARKLLGSDMVIGATAHNSRHLAMCAAEDGADYVAFGAFFPTATKKTEFVATIDLLQWWVEMMEIPCVAIGGITPENISPLVKAGADFVCLSSGIWNATDGSVTAINDLAKQLGC
ncbi:MAG: thiamine phosphate synthase [Robiginitomaculum sp.]|nr:thiamine phosphate synthase [Robiginitomaculum sp.]